MGVTEKDLVRDDNSKFKNSLLQKLDSKLQGLLSEASAEEEFTGKTGQSTVLRLPGLGAKRVGLIGLGSGASATSTYRILGEATAAAAKSARATNVAITLASPEGIPAELKLTSASAIASGKLHLLAVKLLVLLLFCLYECDFGLIFELCRSCVGHLR